MEKIFSDIIQEMSRQKVTEQWLEGQTGIPQSTINRLINGKNKKLDLPKIRIIQKALGIKIGNSISMTSPLSISDYDTGASHAAEPSTEYISMPVHTLAGAGEPCCLETSEPIEHLKVDPRYDGPNISIIKVRGRSMEPVVMDGGYVGIDRTDRHVVSGEMYALWLPHEGAVIKRLWMMPDMVRIVSDNKEAQIFDIPIHRVDWNTFVLGRVKWVLQNI